MLKKHLLPRLFGLVEMQKKLRENLKANIQGNDKLVFHSRHYHGKTIAIFCVYPSWDSGVPF